VIVSPLGRCQTYLHETDISFARFEFLADRIGRMEASANGLG
jgi:hypothetical protein